MSELRDCPHCGAPAILTCSSNGSFVYCHCQEPCENRAEAIAAWNTRVESGWVSVEDRLPEDWDRYNVRLENNTVMEFNYTDIGGRPYWSKIGVGPEEPSNKVTHWQPLPAPPEPKGAISDDQQT